MSLTRMWINQPSTLQPFHNLHGVNVLAELNGQQVVRIYYTHGPVISQMITINALSFGWR